MSAKPKKKEKIKIQVYDLEESVFEELAELAKKEKRSLSKMATILIEVGLKKYKP